MAATAIRVLVNTEDGSEYGLGIGWGDFLHADETEQVVMLAHLFNAALLRAGFDYRVRLIKRQNITEGGLGTFPREE